MLNPARPLESLSAAELEAIATLWKRERRELVTSFNGTSMLPAIAPGQQVVVECGVEPIVGSVALFRFHDQIGVHRVVARSGKWLLTWGDANPLPDEPIEPMCVIGTIRNVPAAPRSLRRALLLRFLGSPRTPIGLLTRRVRLIHRVRAAWAQGLLVFTKKSIRAVFRRRSPC